MGLCVGAAASTVWAVLDWTGVAYTDWTKMGLVTAGAGLLGLVLGFLLKVPTKALSDSIDRRGGLENRLTTSLEIEGEGHFESALKDDAVDKLQHLKPKQLYPFKLGRWQASAVMLCLLASTIFLLGNSPILKSPEARKEEAEVKKLGQSVERIARPVTEPQNASEMTPEEKRLADELRKLQQDLEKARINKEEALQKTNELSKKAEELTKERAKMTEDSLSKAESAFEKLQKAEMEKNGIKMDPEAMRELSKMSSSDRQNMQKQLEQRKQELQEKKAELKSKLDQIKKDLKNPNLTPEQKKALEAMQKQIEEMLKKLEKELAELQKEIENLMNSEKIQELLKKIMDHPAMKEIQEMMAKLAKEAQGQQEGKAPTLTKEDIEAMKEKIKELKKQLEELADQLQDPEAMDEFMKQMMEAMKNGGGMCKNGGLCFGLGSLLGLGMPMPGPDNDVMLFDTGKVNHNKDGKAGQGNTNLTQIKGERRDTGEEAYIEIKGPTTVGTRTSVKYTKVLPSYKKKAEEAIDKKSIPKQHEKRVKEYFDSLTSGK